MKKNTTNPHDSSRHGLVDKDGVSIFRESVAIIGPVEKNFYGHQYIRLDNGQIVRITYRRSRISDLAIHLARTGRLAEPDTSGTFLGEQLNPFGRKFRKMARRIVGVKGERKEHAFLKAQQALNTK